MTEKVSTASKMEKENKSVVINQRVDSTSTLQGIMTNSLVVERLASSPRQNNELLDPSIVFKIKNPVVVQRKKKAPFRTSVPIYVT